MHTTRMGESRIVLSLSYDKTAESVDAVWRVRDRLESHRSPAIRSIQCALDTLLVEFAPGENPSNWEREIKDIALAALNESPTVGKMSNPASIVRIPVCFQREHAPDMSQVASQTGIEPVEITRRICDTVFTVWMIGFMPGFPYLGELPMELQIRRKRNPSISVPAGSVAIADEFLGIYPFHSPGGWHIIGRTPLKITDYSSTRGGRTPWLFQPGMRVQLDPLDPAKFNSEGNA